MRKLIGSVLGLVIVVTGWSFAQPAADKPPEKKAETRSLDELISASLRHSPDLQVAEAKVREAQAELRRDRLTLVQKVIDGNAAVDAARSATKNAEESFRESASLFKSGAMSSADYRAAEGRFAAAKAALAQAESTLNALTGTLPAGVKSVNASDGGSAVPSIGAGIGGNNGISGGVSGVWNNGGISGIPNSGIGSGFGGNWPIGAAGISGAGISGISGGGLGLTGGFGGVAPPRPPQPAMADKLRATLETKIKVEPLKDVPLGEVLKQYQKTAGVPFLLNLGDKSAVSINLSLQGEVSLGAVFQALEDVVPGLKFYVREYGILISMDDSAPEGAMPLIEFWHMMTPGRR